MTNEIVTIQVRPLGKSETYMCQGTFEWLDGRAPGRHDRRTTWKARRPFRSPANVVRAGISEFGEQAVGLAATDLINISKRCGCSRCRSPNEDFLRPPAPLARDGIRNQMDSTLPPVAYDVGKSATS